MTARRGWAAGIALATVLAAARGWAVAEEAGAPGVETVKAVTPLEDPPYDALGRRDPFRAPNAGGTAASGESRTPLQQYDVGQLRLVAVIYDTRDPRAVVEDDQGLGYIVRLGTPIGANGGQVSAIQRGRVVIQESAVDYYGASRPNEVTMELRAAASTPDRTTERGKR